MAQQSWLRPERWVLAAVAFIACEPIGILAQMSSQQNDSCPTTIQLTVDGTSSLSDLHSLLKAQDVQNCSISISVDWNGIIEIDQSITVPSGAELRVKGGGYNGSYVENTISSSSSSSGDDRSNAATASVIRGNSSASLFIVQEDGNLSISGMTLQNGGRGIETFENSRVVSVDCFWDSLSAADSGGAISAKSGTTLTLEGTNIFSGCSSSSSGGGINLKAAALIAQGDVRFESCSASEKGGGLNIQDNSRLQVAEAASVSFSGCTAGELTGDTGGGLCSFTSTIYVGANAKVLFENNSVAGNGDGGGLYAKNSSITLNVGTNMSFINNHAGDKGGGMCIQQIDSEVYTGESDMARGFVLAKGSNATFMGNSCGDSGGGVHFSTGCEVIIDGDVYFEENAGVRAGAMYFEESTAVVSGRATFINNTAERWGGAVMLLDSERGLEFNGPVAARDNSAGRSGGVLYVENAPLVVTTDGGDDGAVRWEGNSAGYDGGVIAVDGGELRMEGGFATSNSAAQRGGVLFATGESLVSWTKGGSFDNSAASGGSIYISNSEFNLTDVRLEGDHTPSGAVVFLAGADARMVNTSIAGPEKMAGDFALHVDAHSVLRAFSCSFERWDGNAKVVMSEGGLVLDACDFSQSSNELLVRALKPATIRNAVLGDENYASAGNNASTAFGSDSQSCSDLPEEYSCLGSGLEEECVNADYGMGVLCAAYVTAATGKNVFLSGSGSSVELVATSAPSPAPSDVVYFPELVMQELTLRYPLASVEESNSSNGASWEVEDAVLWELKCSDGTEYGGSPTGNGFFSVVSADNFSWVAMPTSGVLLRGQEIMISFVGTPPPPQDPSRPSMVYNGEVSATFNVLSRSAEAESRTLSNSATFEVTFYYCTAGAYWDGQECVLCVELMSALEDGDGSLECDMPGVTLDTLPLAAGHWRGDVNRTIVQSCLRANSCKGGRGIVSSSKSLSTEYFLEDDRYCKTGYVGPYCAVCAEGFRRLSGYECLNCEGDWGAGALAALWMAVALTPVLLVSLVMFLFGGTTSFKQLRKKVSHLCGRSESTGVAQWPGREGFETDLKPQGNGDPITRAGGLATRLLRAIPFQQLKILIVVWQILTQFSGLAEIPYPSSYKRFLATLDVFNFDISWPLSAMCLVGKINFYEKLVLVTIAPMLVLGALGLSYAGAMQWHRGADRGSIECRRQAKVRHTSTALLVLFLIFSSVSTTIFSTYSCEFVEDLDINLLRADFSISCDDDVYLLYQIYAGAMILAYPIGIPMTFAYLLLERRDKINPPEETEAESTPPNVATRAVVKRPGRATSSAQLGVAGFYPATSEGTSRSINAEEEFAGRAAVGVGTQRLSREFVSSGGETNRTAGEQSMFTADPSCDSDAHRQEALRERAQDPDLQPTKFLWEPYEPHNFYFETVECGRRCLLTGALVFVRPNTAIQMAGACIFAFMSLLVFELIRPHLSQTDSWMYRIGCIVIFFSNFLGLMAKADVSGEDAQSQELFGSLLICVHAAMLLAIIVQSYLAMQAASESRDDLVDNFLPKTEIKETLSTSSRTFSSRGGLKRITPRMTLSAERRKASRGGINRIDERVRLSAPTRGVQPWNGLGLQKKGDGSNYQVYQQQGSGSMPTDLRIQRTRPVLRTWQPQDTMAVGNSRPALDRKYGRTSSKGSLAYLDLDASQAAPEAVFGPRFQERPRRQTLRMALTREARGGLFSSNGASRGGGTSSAVPARVDSASPHLDYSNPALRMFGDSGVAAAFGKDGGGRTSLNRTRVVRPGLLHRLSGDSTKKTSASPIAPFDASARGRRSRGNRGAGELPPRWAGISSLYPRLTASTPSSFSETIGAPGSTTSSNLSDRFGESVFDYDIAKTESVEEAGSLSRPRLEVANAGRVHRASPQRHPE